MADHNKSVFSLHGYEVVSRQPDGIYHLRSVERGFDGLGILLFPPVCQEGFDAPTVEYATDGSLVYGRREGIESPASLADHVLAVMGNCIGKDGGFDYELAVETRNWFTDTTADIFYGTARAKFQANVYPLQFDLARDGLGRILRDKVMVPRDATRMRCFAEFESGDVVFYR